MVLKKLFIYWNVYGENARMSTGQRPLPKQTGPSFGPVLLTYILLIKHYLIELKWVNVREKREIKRENNTKKEENYDTPNWIEAILQYPTLNFCPGLQQPLLSSSICTSTTDSSLTPTYSYIKATFGTKSQSKQTQRPHSVHPDWQISCCEQKHKVE